MDSGSCVVADGMVTFHLAPFKSQSECHQDSPIPSTPNSASRPTCSSRWTGRRAAGLREQLEGELRRAVRAGRLAIGTALPPSRVLARELGVARSVVVDAYGQLAAEGYLEARQGSGTRVRATQPHDAAGDAGAAAAGPTSARGCSAGCPTRRASRARSGSATTARRSARCPTSSLAVSRPARRRGAAGRARRRTSAACAPSSRRPSTAPGLRRVHAGPGARLPRAAGPRARGAWRSRIPCFSYHRELIANAGLEPVPVAVDGTASTSAALAADDDVAGVLVAPAHSYPTGAVLAPQRRVELAEWARATDALIIEDDYDAEFRYDRAPIGALQGLRPDRVVYGGSVEQDAEPDRCGVGWLAGARVADAATCGARSSTTTSRPARSTSSRSRRFIETRRPRPPPAPRAARLPAPARRRAARARRPPARRDARRRRGRACTSTSQLPGRLRRARASSHAARAAGRADRRAPRATGPSPPPRRPRSSSATARRARRRSSRASRRWRRPTRPVPGRSGDEGAG